MCGYTHSARRRAGCRRARVDVRASDVARNSTAEWCHLCRYRPYGLQCAAHGRNRRRRRGNAGIGLRCGRTRSLEFTGPLARSDSRCSRRRRNRSGWRGAPGRTKEPIVRGPSRRVPAPSWPSPAACPSFIPASAFLLSCVPIHVAAHQESTGSRALQQPVDSWIHVGLHRPKLRGVVRFRGVWIYAPGRSSGGYRGESDLPRRYTAIDCLFPTSAPPTVARRISETCD